MADVGLYFLRLQESVGQWKLIEVNGDTPGKRYGHVLIFAKPNLILFGGNT
jgi:protein phosphatase